MPAAPTRSPSANGWLARPGCSGGPSVSCRSCHTILHPLAVLLIRPGHPVRAHHGVMDEPGERRQAEHPKAGVFGDAFPRLDDGRDFRVVWQPRVKLRLVVM